MRRQASLPSTLAALAALALACSEPEQPAAVAVSPDTVTLASIGATRQLTATVTDSKGKTLTAATVTWAADNTAVVKVDTTGRVTAVGVGTSDVTASAGTVSGAASVTVDPGNNVAKAGGDNQYGYQGTRLPQLIAVLVRDQQGNNVAKYRVQFLTDPGNGTPDSSIAFTGTDGIARTGWVMPNGPDTVTLRAEVVSAAGAPLLGSPVTYTAISHNVNVASTSPSTLVEGQSVTLTGTGFDAGNTQNVVTIDGEAATITAASATQLTVTVPSHDCAPSRTVSIQVTVGGLPALPVSRPLTTAATTLNLAVGSQAIFTDPAQFCFQLPPATSAQGYLIGVQSTSETPSNLTPIKLVGTAAAAAAPPMPAPVQPVPQAPARAIPPAAAERLERWRRYGQAELAQRAFDRRFYRQARAAGRRAASQLRAPAAVPATANVGDTVVVRIATGNSCTAYVEDTTIVKAKGTTNFILADIRNPANYSQAQYTTFSQQYDNTTAPTEAAEFGTPTDQDGNSRIAIVVTKEVNKRGPLGFTASCDFFARDTVSNYASNDGEIFYVVSPDPNGVFGGTYSVQSGARDFPDLIAHESVHVIQFGRRIAAGAADFLDTWQAEGQAVLGEEVVGFAVEGHQPGQNLGIGPAANLDDTTSTDWYGTGFIGLGLYFGWDPVTNPNNRNGKVSGAPWECTWLDANPDPPAWPCVGGMDPYGAPWSLLRYLSDRFGNGNEATIQQGMIENPQTGFAAVQSLVGVRMDTLLAQWAAMLFADDSVPNAAAELKMASWNLKDVFYGSYTFPGLGTVSLYPSLRLAPVTSSYSNVALSANVRAASSYYAVFSGTRSAYALKARDASGTGILPATMRYWVLRIQ
jgi:hypothetical protein